MSRLRPALRTRLLPLSLLLGAAFAPVLHAQSLGDLYNAARSYDATYQSAKNQYDADLAKAEQAKALLLPSASLNAGANGNTLDSTSPGGNANYGYQTQTASVSVTQPLYRPANVASYEQGMKQIELAHAQLQAAEQDLIVRVSQAYFDVLTAKDNLTFVQAQKAAVVEQLASANRNFEVGTSTVNDSRDAQAKYDLVVAQELAADNDLRVKTLALRQLVGKSDADPKPLRAPLVIPPLRPATMDEWLQQASTNHPQTVQLQVALDVAKLTTQIADAAAKPTLDLGASYTATNAQNGSSNSYKGYDTRTNIATLGVNFSMPLFSGYAIQNRIKETLALEDKARNDLEAGRRNVEQATRTAFLGVQSGQAQVKAYEAAEVSSQSALDATKLGYQVGVRINMDVLNAQSQLYSTKATLAKARYDVLVGELKLKQAAGTLTPDDITPINDQIAP